METSVNHPHHGSAIAAAMLLSALAQSPAFAADGTIRFVGAVVAAPYEISPQRATTIPATARGRATRELVFERQRIDRPSASLEVLPVGARALDVAYVDSRGRRHVLGAHGALAIGRDGGRLTLEQSPPGRGDRIAAAALLIVTYD